MDVQKRRAATASQLPMLLGGEVAAEIDAVGASVSSFVIGDPVMTYLEDGHVQGKLAMTMQ